MTVPKTAWSPVARARRGSIRSLRVLDVGGVLYVLPALAFLAVVLLLPVAMTAGLSLTSWDGLGPIKWVGLANYAALLSDPIVTTAMGNAVVMTFFTLGIPIVIGLATAIVLSRITRRLRTLWRTLLFLPAVIAPVVVAVGWRLVYEPTTGLLNGLLSAVGLSSLAQPWLGDFGLALPATGVVATWMEYGLVMVLFLAGIQRISPELFDAAKVDGAGLTGEVRHVTIPGLRYELLVAIVVTLIDSFRNFALIFNLTKGGPGNATVVPVLEVYRRGILHGRVGSASAIGITITVVLVLLVLGVLWLARRRGGDEAAR
jgi:raffinose/stachyose/melibiose transport system permease protein